MEIRTEFHKKLRGIQGDVLAMGSMVEKAILRSKKRFDIEEKCMELIATQQPMAVDLRIIMSVVNVITELERIGDYAEGIAKIVIMIGDELPLKPLVTVPRMAEKTVDMLQRSLEAFIKHDAETARRIATEDDEVDHLYNDLYRVLISFMLEDPKTITRATRLIWVAHDLERSADRVTNICERVVFTVTGKMEEIGASKY
jgi:phosphate transport system protein